MMSFTRLYQIAKKDLLLLSRDRSGLFFTIGFPLVMAIFFGTAFSGGASKAGISLAIADLDQSPASIQYISELKKSSALRITEMSSEQAQQKVHTGKVAAFLIIPKGYAETRKNMFDPLVPEVQLGIDPSKKAAAGMLEGVLMAQAAEDMQAAFTDATQLSGQVKQSIEQLNNKPDTDPELVSFLGTLDHFLNSQKNKPMQNSQNNSFQQGSSGAFTPLKITIQDVQRKSNQPHNAYAISFPQGIIWGVIGAISTFSLALVSEIRQGTLGRLSSTPISRMSVLGGKALACFATILTVSFLLIIIGIVAFGIDVQSWSVLILTLLSTGIGFSGLMMLLSVLGKTEKAASGISWAILMLMSMLGGGMIPLMFMPKWMAAFADVSPIKWAILSLEGSLWRGFGIIEVLPSITLLITLGAACFVLASYRFNKMEIS